MRLQFWIQAAHARALDILAHSGHFPWGKDTDVARWAIQHGLNYVDKIDVGVITSLMSQANIINEINDAETRNLKFAENFERTQANVLMWKGLGETELARDLVMRVWATIKAMPEEPEREARWKKRYMDKFQDYFKDLIEYE